MHNYSPTLKLMDKTQLSCWSQRLPEQIKSGFNPAKWGDLPKWQKIFEQLPDIKPSIINLNSDAICIGKKEDCDDTTRNNLEQLLRQLPPWRKGPFDLFGIHIDSEWQAQIKWNRIKNHIEPLKDRIILDVGASNGYYSFRMLGEDAQLVIGIDPTLIYVIQFLVFQKYVQNANVSVFPVGVEDVPPNLHCFDTVFSMGVLYHRKQPQEHIKQLNSFLRQDGQLILETLVIDAQEGDVLIPKKRYAQMPNVWNVPSLLTVEKWLKDNNFKEIRCVNVSKTDANEQRVTDWMGFQSLKDFLDPDDLNKTIEGYPAPQRAVFLAKKS